MNNLYNHTDWGHEENFIYQNKDKFVVLCHQKELKSPDLAWFVFSGDKSFITETNNWNWELTDDIRYGFHYETEAEAREKLSELL